MLAGDLAVYEFWYLIHHSLKQSLIPFSTGGTILQNSVVKMCSVQIMASAMMGCGVLTVHACWVSQAAGKLTFNLHILCRAKRIFI